MKRAPHIPLTEKQFRRQKRKEFQALEEALEALATGSGYLPKASTKGILHLEAAAAEVKKGLAQWWKGY